MFVNFILITLLNALVIKLMLQYIDKYNVTTAGLLGVCLLPHFLFILHL